MKKFMVTISVQNPRAILSEMQTRIVDGISEEEVYQEWQRRLFTSYPSNSGWTNHNVSVIGVNRDEKTTD